MTAQDIRKEAKNKIDAQWKLRKDWSDTHTGITCYSSGFADLYVEHLEKLVIEQAERIEETEKEIGALKIMRRSLTEKLGDDLDTIADLNKQIDGLEQAVFAKAENCSALSDKIEELKAEKEMILQGMLCIYHTYADQDYPIYLVIKDIEALMSQFKPTK